MQFQCPGVVVLVVLVVVLVVVVVVVVPRIKYRRLGSNY
jgi:hypothetical protein